MKTLISAVALSIACCAPVVAQAAAPTPSCGVSCLDQQVVGNLFVVIVRDAKGAPIKTVTVDLASATQSGAPATGLKSYKDPQDGSDWTDISFEGGGMVKAQIRQFKVDAASIMLIHTFIYDKTGSMLDVAVSRHVVSRAAAQKH